MRKGYLTGGKVKNYLNEPIDYEWTKNDIKREYERCQDKKRLLVFGI